MQDEWVGRIRPKAMVILLSADGQRHLVSRHGATRENPEGFDRLIGGGIEFGETRRAAAIREVREELLLDLDEQGVRLREAAVLESIFAVDGRPGHEIVFVYAATLPGGLVPDEGGTFAEADGSPLHVYWRGVQDSARTLYPDGALELVQDVGQGAGD